MNCNAIFITLFSMLFNGNNFPNYRQAIILDEDTFNSIANSKVWPQLIKQNDFKMEIFAKQNITRILSKENGSYIDIFNSKAIDENFPGKRYHNIICFNNDVTRDDSVNMYMPSFWHYKIKE